jgi:hypothetical protein
MRVISIWNKVKREELTVPQAMVLIGALTSDIDWTAADFKKKFKDAYTFCKKHKLIVEDKDPGSNKRFVSLPSDFRTRISTLARVLESRISFDPDSSTSSSKSKNKRGENGSNTDSGKKISKSDEQGERAKLIRDDEVYQRVYAAISPYINSQSTSAWSLASGTKDNPYKHYQIMCLWDENGFDWAAYAEWYRDEGPYQDKGFRWPLFLSSKVVEGFQSAQEGREYAKRKKDRYLKTTTNLKNDEKFKAKAQAFREKQMQKKKEGEE